MTGIEIDERLQQILPTKEELKKYLEEEYLGQYRADDLWSWLYNVMAKNLSDLKAIGSKSLN